MANETTSVLPNFYTKIHSKLPQSFLFVSNLNALILRFRMVARSDCRRQFILKLANRSHYVTTCQLYQQSWMYLTIFVKYAYADAYLLISDFFVFPVTPQKYYTVINSKTI